MHLLQGKLGDWLRNFRWTHVAHLTTAGRYGWSPDRWNRVVEHGFVRWITRVTKAPCPFALVVEGVEGVERHAHGHLLTYSPRSTDCARLGRGWLYNAIQEQLDGQAGLHLAGQFRDSTPDEWQAICNGLKPEIRCQIPKLERQLVEPYDPARGICHYLAKDLRLRGEVELFLSNRMPPLVADGTLKNAA